MTKGYRNPNIATVLKAAEERPEFVEWVNSRGIKMTLKPIPPYLFQMIAASVDHPKAPTYTITTASGSTVEQVHDETSISQSSEEEKLAWEQYKLLDRKATEQVTEMIIDLILLEGVETDSAVEDKQAKRMKVLRVDLPEDPDERTLMLRRAYLIGCKEDAEAITSIAMVLTGVSPDDLNLARKSFRDQVESES